MPTIAVKRRQLASVFGDLSDDEVDHLLFRFGLELEEVSVDDGQSNAIDKEVVYKVEIPANRYDLLSSEGLLMALQTFFKSKAPTRCIARVGSPSALLKVDPSVADVRPYVVAAILRDVAMTQDVLESLIDLQEKLHFGIGRRRALVSIGVHNLDAIRMPILYTSRPPAAIQFKALNQSQVYSAAELMKLYANDLHLRQYLHIIDNCPRYPVIYDADNVVLSMPPIINGDRTKVTTATKNLMIEVTATDLNRAEIVLDTLVSTFSQYCRLPYTVETVDVLCADGQRTTYPTLPSRLVNVAVAEVNRVVGVSLNAVEIACYLRRMGLEAAPDDSDAQVAVTVPPNRRDILHERDIVEDIAVAYGYAKIVESVPPVATVGRQTSVNKMTETMRRELAAAGFTEALTFALCAKQDLCSRLNRADGLRRAVHVANPKTQDFQVARTCLLPGILKTIHYNRNCPLPLKLFEIQEVLLKTDDDRKALNQRNVCCVFYGKTSGFEVIHGLLDHLMSLLAVPYDVGRADGYWIEECQDDTYFPGRCAAVRLSAFDQPIGTMGVLHPTVTRAFGLQLVCSCFELNFEQLLSAARCP